MGLPEMLKQRRKSLGYTLKEIGEMVGVSEATVQRWESGNIKNIPYGRIICLAEVLKITPSHLMGWDCGPSPIMEDPLWRAIQENHTKKMLATWICSLEQDQLEMVEDLLKAARMTPKE